jgi:diaminohydroxyphosphoribosylaminopyrimidine deaminase/5-amino-6-(5-phosphoribosylamino)uracil reductase
MNDESGSEREISESRIAAADRRYMKRALELSKRGQGRTCPNPLVGAVIVKEGRVIGEGWHRGPGLPHAEIEALRSCTEDPRGATIYVTLEPCNHFGRTPPCSEALIAAGIAEVQYAIADPNPVAGGGAARLARAGVKVAGGVGRREALELNRRFFHFCLTGRPWVILKAAMSLDGKITGATGQSQWITGPAARRVVHRLRSEVAAVLVGVETVRADDPQLTNRTARPAVRQPLRVVFDSNLRLPDQSKLVRESPEQLIVFCTRKAGAERIQQLSRSGVRVIRQEGDGAVDPAGALESLGGMGVQSVLAEGGAGVFTSLVRADLVNEYYLFYAPFFIGGPTAKGVVGGPGVAVLAEAPRLTVAGVRRVGNDVLVHAYREELATCLPV